MIDDDGPSMLDEAPRTRARYPKPAEATPEPSIVRRGHKRRTTWDDIGITILFALIALAVLVYGVHVLGVPR